MISIDLFHVASFTHVHRKPAVSGSILYMYVILLYRSVSVKLPLEHLAVDVRGPCLTSNPAPVGFVIEMRLVY